MMAEQRAKNIKISTDFSRFPGGRFLSDGKFSGERFRDDFLAPALKGGSVVLDMDGPLGYGSSFLEEAFGGLVRECGFDKQWLESHLILKSMDPGLLSDVRTYISEAADVKNSK